MARRSQSIKSFFHYYTNKIATFPLRFSQAGRLIFTAAPLSMIRGYAVQGKIGGVWAGNARPNTPIPPPTA